MDKQNKIILSAETDLKDNELREWFEKMWRKLETINERTKRHTLDIKRIEKRLKNVEKQHKS